MKNKLLILSLLIILSQFAKSQSMNGMWTVDKVTAGEQNVTPVAKWFNYNKDYTYEAGNGWLQNDKGTWSYDKKKKEFLPESMFGKDEFGAFKVEFLQDKMIWKRYEEGMDVVITLSRIKEKPMSPKDSLSGSWILVKVTKDNTDITSTYDPQNNESLFISWTQNYRKVNPDGSNSRGYWYLHAHRPEFRLIDFDRAKEVLSYDISFKENYLIMKSKTDSNIIYTYQRK